MNVNYSFFPSIHWITSGSWSPFSSPNIFLNLIQLRRTPSSDPSLKTNSAVEDYDS